MRAGTGKWVAPVLAVAALVMALAGQQVAAEKAMLPGDCDVVVGPTSDDALTQANITWTREVIRRVEELGVDCALHHVASWARANHMFANAQAEVLFPEIVGDRGLGGMTGMPVASTYGFVVLTPVASPRLNSLEDLAGKTVGVIRGRFYPERLRRIDGIELEESGSFERNIKKLLYGRIDATLEYLSDARRHLAEGDLSAQIHYGEEFGSDLLAYRFTLSEHGAQLMALFNTAVARLVADGSYHEIFEETTQRLIYPHEG